MKAWVIKNKEGEYKREDVIEYVWKETTSYFSKDIRCADIFTEEEMAKCYCPKDCEVVEITIAEGDLEQQLAIAKRALLKASKEAFGNKISVVTSNYSKKITNSKEYAEYLIFEAESEVKNGN